MDWEIGINDAGIEGIVLAWSTRSRECRSKSKFLNRGLTSSVGPSMIDGDSFGINEWFIVYCVVQCFSRDRGWRSM